jgi:hypothetical protein
MGGLCPIPIGSTPRRVYALEFVIWRQDDPCPHERRRARGQRDEFDIFPDGKQIRTDGRPTLPQRRATNSGS